MLQGWLNVFEYLKIIQPNGKPPVLLKDMIIMTMHFIDFLYESAREVYMVPLAWTNMTAGKYGPSIFPTHTSCSLGQFSNHNPNTTRAHRKLQTHPVTYLFNKKKGLANWGEALHLLRTSGSVEENFEKYKRIFDQRLCDRMFIKSWLKFNS